MVHYNKGLWYVAVIAQRLRSTERAHHSVYETIPKKQKQVPMQKQAFNYSLDRKIRYITSKLVFKPQWTNIYQILHETKTKNN